MYEKHLFCYENNHTKPSVWFVRIILSIRVCYEKNHTKPSFLFCENYSLYLNARKRKLKIVNSSHSIQSDFQSLDISSESK
mmetsp:Transcript_21245/g.32523  ORF Transcript_21245/g.32523 Transcript_21245/m.32523 type:complete len:81 (-) Transcript_21245:835-1077(-)